MNTEDIVPLLHRIADALDRLAPSPTVEHDLSVADAFVWHAEADRLEPVEKVNRVPLDLLRGIDRQTDILFNNTDRFAKGLPANNALLWGAPTWGASLFIY